MSDTPRTDAAIEAIWDDRDGRYIPWVSVDHARDLERELAEANAVVKHLEGAAEAWREKAQRDDLVREELQGAESIGQLAMERLQAENAALRGALQKISDTAMHWPAAGVACGDIARDALANIPAADAPDRQNNGPSDCGDFVSVPRYPTGAMYDAFASVNCIRSDVDERITFSGDFGNFVACYQAMLGAPKTENTNRDSALKIACAALEFIVNDYPRQTNEGAQRKASEALAQIGNARCTECGHEADRGTGFVRCPLGEFACPQKPGVTE